MIKLNGYSVVLIPEDNYFSDAEIELYRHPPENSGIYYSGFMRSPYGDMDLLKLQSNISILYARIREIYRLGVIDYIVTDKFGDAVEMFNYLNLLEDGKKYELIGLNAPSMKSILSEHDYAGEYDFLGYDINANGYSMILYAFFEKPYLFQEEIEMMNRFGLLDDIDSVKKLIDRYLSEQTGGKLEIVNRSDIEPVSIYRLRLH